MAIFQVKKRTKRVSELFQSYHPYTHKVMLILTFVMLNSCMDYVHSSPISYCKSAAFQYVFSIRVDNNVDPDQMALSEAS